MFIIIISLEKSVQLVIPSRMYSSYTITLLFAYNFQHISNQSRIKSLYLCLKFFHNFLKIWKCSSLLSSLHNQKLLVLHMITLNPLILRVQVMLYPFFTIMLNPSNTSMGMCFLETIAAYMKLWVAPPSINVVTLCPCKMPLTLSCITRELLKEWKWSSSLHHPIVVRGLWTQAMVAPPHYDILNLG